MFVGITSGATTVWNPLSGTSSCTGCCSGGFSCLGWSMNTIAVSTLTLLSAAPTPNTRLLFFLRLDSMRLSNTGFRPPVHDQVTPYEIPPIGPRPLVEPPLQNDDSRVRGLHRQRGGLSVKLIGRRTSTPPARPRGRPRPKRALTPSA